MKCAVPPRLSKLSRRSQAPQNGGLIVTASPAAIVHRDLIIALAARHRLPAIYFARFFHQRWRPHLLWGRSDRSAPPRGGLCRSHPQGREAGRLSGAGADQVRNGAQPQGREGVRPRRSSNATRSRRRGDRMNWRTLLSRSSAARQHGRSRRARSSRRCRCRGFLEHAIRAMSPASVPGFRQGLNASEVCRRSERQD